MIMLFSGIRLYMYFELSYNKNPWITQEFCFTLICTYIFFKNKMKKTARSKPHRNIVYFQFILVNSTFKNTQKFKSYYGYFPDSCFQHDDYTFFIQYLCATIRGGCSPQQVISVNEKATINTNRKRFIYT